MAMKKRKTPARVRITRKQFIRATGIGAVAVGVAAVGLSKTAHAKGTAPTMDGVASDGFYDIYPDGSPNETYSTGLPRVMSEGEGSLLVTRDAYRIIMAANYGQDENGAPIPEYQGKIRLKAVNEDGEYTPFNFGETLDWGEFRVWILFRDCAIEGEILKKKRFEQVDSSITKNHPLYGKAVMTTIGRCTAAIGFMNLPFDMGESSEKLTIRMRNLVFMNPNSLLCGTYGYCDVDIENVKAIGLTADCDGDVVVSIYCHSTGRWAVRNCELKSACGNAAYEIGMGLDAMPWPGYTGSDIEMIGNDIELSAPYGSAIVAWWEEGAQPDRPLTVRIRDNKASGWVCLDVSESSADVLAKDNKFHLLPDGNGISFWNVSDASVKDNKFVGQAGFGVYVDGASSDNVFIGNNLSKADAPVLYYFGESTSNNTVRGFSGGNEGSVVDLGTDNHITNYTRKKGKKEKGERKHENAFKKWKAKWAGKMARKK
jgi:parallel beta-helix repeat protein